MLLFSFSGYSIYSTTVLDIQKIQRKLELMSVNSLEDYLERIICIYLERIATTSKLQHQLLETRKILALIIMSLNFSFHFLVGSKLMNIRLH
ncbi:MAG: hypothetical protein ACI8RD_008911 [Bacillariaceae sp.]|jgi:hypothetical protein